MLTQYMSSSLIKHLSRNWRLSGFGEYIEVVPAQMRLGEFWYRGTADAVYQNLNLVRDARAEHVAVFGGDHIYKFAVDQMEDAHRDTHADLTVAAFPVPTAEASAFGIIDVDDARPDHRLRREADEPAGDARPARLVAGLDGQLHLPARGARARARSTTAACRARATTSAATSSRSCVAERRARVRLRLRAEPHPGRARGRDAVLARRRHDRPLLHVEHGAARARARRSISTTGSGGSAARSATTRPPGSCAPARAAAPREVDDSLICEGSIIASAAVREIGARLRLLRPRRRRRRATR